ncbi:hypothetical protein NG697_00810 [Pseudarthrobacter sp. MDT3-26]|uniref:TY-Chap domain-containing protein n=1 Tax=Pseudarthrobacter raffinosi TaxID=2953651 RepID=UPI00208ED18C|nr:hypothetical protein [Pseudarthrobacter sp. MDT3-26]MCO4261493.1 hypothetical protein [Pseudarthrobacter sp. MDT3-26]
MTTPHLGSTAAGDRAETIEQAMRSFLAGDPLRSISEATNLSSWDLLGILSGRIADRGEKLRSTALRDRCSSTARILVQEMERFEQLMSAGIDVLDVPKVLAALGVQVDVPIAVEMLRSMPIVKDIHGRVSHIPEGLPIDALSLLYATGFARGLTPDHELALGRMDPSSIAEIRNFLGQSFSYKKTARILGLIETTAEAIRAGDVAGISYSDYEEIAWAHSGEEGDTTANPTASWPVPAKDLRRRLGQGFWETALNSVGLELLSANDRFGPTDFVAASRGFMESYRYFGSPKDVSSYDSWVIAEAAAGRDRPSVIAIRRHFGAWESVIGAVMPPEVGEEEFAGLVELCRTQNSVEERWARAGELVSEVLAKMPWNSFLSIDYGDETDGPRRPYAQANPSADGVWCEIVSGEFLPADEWPIDTDYLLRNGWSAPDEEVPNWHKQGVPPLEAGHQLLEGLARGRRCHDPEKVRWHSGDFPGGPGPDGGVILDFETGGAVRDLRRAS